MECPHCKSEIELRVGEENQLNNTMADKKKTAAKTKDGLNLLQEEFCQLFTTPDRDWFGNGTQCYIEVYNPKRVGNWYLTAKAASSRLLTNVNVIARVNELLDSEGFNDENVDKQHLFLINQFDDKRTKLGAIAEYNKLKSRITRRLDITSAGKSISKYEELTNEELARIAEGRTGDS